MNRSSRVPLHWRQRVKPVIKSHELQRFVMNPIFPTLYLIENNHTLDHVNPKYEA